MRLAFPAVLLLEGCASANQTGIRAHSTLQGWIHRRGQTDHAVASRSHHRKTLGTTLRGWSLTAGRTL